MLLALWVILHHLASPGMMLEVWCNTLPAPLESLIRGGYLAVQTFFLLSGFVLARSYARAAWTRPDLIRYATARFARIYPVYLFSLVIVAPFIWKAMTRAPRPGLLANYLLLLQGWTAPDPVGWNTPAWTLSCEFFFYLMFPVVFPALRNAGWKALTATMALAIVTPILLDHAGLPWSLKPIYDFSDFLAGIVAARAFTLTESRLINRGTWLYLPALAAGALLIVYPQVMKGTYGDVNSGLRPLNALALIGLALGGGATARWLSTAPLQYLGKISFSMYIVHVPILWWYGDWSRRMPAEAAALVYLAIVIAASAMAFELIEMPANRFIRNRVSARLHRPTHAILSGQVAA